MEVSSKDIEVPATDEFPLKATLFVPQQSDTQLNLKKIKAVVLVASATGVKRGYYAAFASYLVHSHVSSTNFQASNGCVALIYDNRGIGDSRPKSLVG
jgi:predicted alpha/beta hydrolase